MIVVLSDTHLGAPASNVTGLKMFIEDYLRPNQNDIDHLFLMGDILDLWRRDNSEVVGESLQTLEMIGALPVETHYVVGNHDLVARNREEWLESDSTDKAEESWNQLVETVGSGMESEAIKKDGMALRFCHGHQIDYWVARRFYDAFCKGLCRTTSFSGEWVALVQYASSLSTAQQNRIRKTTLEEQAQYISALAGPLDFTAESPARRRSREWELLVEMADPENLRTTIDKDVVTGVGDGAEDSEERIPNTMESLSILWQEHLESLDRHPEGSKAADFVRSSLHKLVRFVGQLNIGLQDDEFLIRGHGHILSVDGEHRIADAGCWLGERGSFLEISEGQVIARSWPTR